MPLSDARRAVDDLAASPAFEETFDNTRSPFSGAGIAVAVTVAFGDRDWISRRVHGVGTSFRRTPGGSKSRAGVCAYDAAGLGLVEQPREQLRFAVVGSWAATAVHEHRDRNAPETRVWVDGGAKIVPGAAAPVMVVPPSSR
jgi:hypothetical protein